MRLSRFEIHNFKGVQAASFDWEDLIVLIGENNVGKSSVLQALQIFLSGSAIKDPALFRDHVSDDPRAIELIGHFDQLTPAETQAPAVQGRMHAQEWILKKRFWSHQEPGESELTWHEAYFSFSSEEVFQHWPAPDNTWASFPADYQPIIQQIPNSGNRPNVGSREQLRVLVRQQRPDLVGYTAPAWVANPGGGGNWKSNANSVVPRFILVRAVHDAADEAISKEASAYGRILGLIVERRLLQRPEVVALKASLDAVLRLFRPNPDDPTTQAPEIRELEATINGRLNEVIGGTVSIHTSAPDVQPVLLPNTTLVVKDAYDSVSTEVSHQGHGLQRTLIMTLLQVMGEIQNQPIPGQQGGAGIGPRAVILAIEEPELYMHPQMERKMRDTLYRLASQVGTQVICTTHSPVFLDMAQRHRSIIRVVKNPDRAVVFSQVVTELFDGAGADAEKLRLRLIATFHPAVNEVFFAGRVVLVEGPTETSVFERGAELMGLFERHPHVRRDVTLVNCQGKPNIPIFQKVLNHFHIPYLVLHDEDQGNPFENGRNETIAGLCQAAEGASQIHMISPNNIEALLGYAATGKDKQYQALQRVEALHQAGGLPPAFQLAVRWAYFGQADEPLPQ